MAHDSGNLFNYQFRDDLSGLLKDEFRHVDLTGMFEEIGYLEEDGQAEELSKHDRVMAVLKEGNSMPRAKALRMAGFLIGQFMSRAELGSRGRWSSATSNAMTEVLEHHGFVFDKDAGLRPQLRSPASRSLEQILEERDFVSVEDEFRRTEANLAADPAAALLAACAILESLLRTYIDDTEGLNEQDGEGIRSMWKKVRDHVDLDPSSKDDKDVKQILSSLGGLLDGIAKLRSDVSSAHGKGRVRYRIQERHALLAVNAAHTMSTFLIQTWEARGPSIARK